MKKNRRWICTDVWMDIFPHFDRPQLGLKLALLSPRFNALVDKHFDGKRELTLWREIKIRKMGIKAKLFIEESSGKTVQFPMPDHPMHNKIRFENLQIDYIDHSVIKFIRDNQQIFDKGTNLRLDVPSTKYVKSIWNVFAHEIWPIFAPNICHLSSFDGRHLNNLRHHTSPSILTDLDIISIHSVNLLPASMADDGPKSKAGKALSKWLHTPRNDGQPKRLRTQPFTSKKAAKLVNNLKEAFLRATTSSACYIIRIEFDKPTEIVPFELMNEQTNEKLTLEKKGDNGNANDHLVLKRWQIGRTIQWENGNPSILNNVYFWIDSDSGTNCIGHCSTKDGQKERKKSS